MLFLNHCKSNKHRSSFYIVVAIDQFEDYEKQQ